MRKILALLLVAVMCVFALASCELLGLGEPEECQHTFSESWSTDAENHWHAATCEHGEMNKDLAAHADADEDGLCDVCEYEVGHEHSFAAEWSIDEESHWKAATCSHTDEKGEAGLHKDDDTNGVCDVCEGHVHILDVAGFCDGCDKEVKPVDRTDIAALINAAAVRGGKANGGKVEMSFVGNNKTENNQQTMWHIQEFVIGTNGTYVKRTEKDVNFEGQLTGFDLITEKWIPYGTEDGIIGVIAMTVDGKYVDAQPTVFGVDDLNGYYYAVSTLADGYTPAAVLFTLYEASQSDNASDVQFTTDPENNAASMSFGVFVVQMSIINDEPHYNVNYYDVTASFTYSDEYTITSLDITCDCYTSDPGANMGGSTLDADVDLTYDPVNNTITFIEGCAKDTYTFSITQTIGERTEIELNDGSQFMPTDYGVYEDQGFTTEADSLELTVGDNGQELYINATPDETFVSFFVRDAEVTVTKDGELDRGLEAYLVGYAIQLFPRKGGEYVVTVEALGITKTVTVTVIEQEIEVEEGYDDTGVITLEVTETYSWDQIYSFAAPKTGYYVFYIPVNLGIHTSEAYNKDMPPEIDYQTLGYKAEVHVIADGYTQGGDPIGKFYTEGRPFSFHFSAPTKGTYEIVWVYYETLPTQQ